MFRRPSWVQCVQVRPLRTRKWGPALPVKASQGEQRHPHQASEGKDAAQTRAFQQSERGQAAPQAPRGLSPYIGKSSRTRDTLGLSQTCINCLQPSLSLYVGQFNFYQAKDHQPFCLLWYIPTMLTPDSSACHVSNNHPFQKNRKKVASNIYTFSTIQLFY